jgi:hypothetical protein
MSNPKPEFWSGKAVCVDVTPLRPQQSTYGQRHVFQVGFELDEGRRPIAWTPQFTPTLHPRSELRHFLRSWFGRDLSQAELENFDTEDLLGMPAYVAVEVEQGPDGKLRIISCAPDESGSPLIPSGQFIRVKNRTVAS